MPDTLPLIIRSLALAMETLAFSLPLGMALAWLLTRSDLPGRRLGQSIIVALLFMPLYLQTSAWQAGFGIEGWYSSQSSGEAWLTGWNAAVWVHVMVAIPWVVLFVSLGLRIVEPALEEQAMLDGTGWQVFLRITLPLCWPALGLAAVWIGMATAGEMTATSIFSVRTYAEEVFNNVATHSEMGETVSALLPGILGTLVMLGLGMALCVRLARVTRPVDSTPSRVHVLGKWRWPLAIALAITMFVLAGVPLGNLIYKAGVVVLQLEGGRLRTWSAGKCIRVIVGSPWLFRRECFWSALVGTLAATGAVAVAIPLAWLARNSRWLGMLGLLIGLICLVIPGPILALAIIALLNRPDSPLLIWLYDRSIMAPWIALTVRALGPALLVVWHGVRTIPQQTFDSAATDGCGFSGQLVRVVLPQRLRVLAVAWLIGSAVAMGDLTGSILVVPPAVETLSIRIFNLVHYGVEDQVAGICLAMTALLGGLAFLVQWAARRF